MNRRDSYIRKYGPVGGPVILRLLAKNAGKGNGKKSAK